MKRLSPRRPARAFGGVIAAVGVCVFICLASITLRSRGILSISADDTRGLEASASSHSALRAPPSSHNQRRGADTSDAAVSVKPIDSSRGIVLCLHDRIVPLGLSLIKGLRCLGNSEVIEIYHCDHELSDENQRLLRETDATIDIIDVCRDLISRGIMDVETAHSFRSYWLKPLAVHESQLDELILLDADAILLRDPARLRELNGYRRTGTTFFYDRVIRAPSFFNRDVRVPSLLGGQTKKYLPHWIETFDYARFDLEYQPSEQLLQSLAYRGETCHEQDSSMLAIKKTQFGADKAMQLLWFLATEHRFAESFSWGDKEAFWLAYELAHVPYFFSPWGASVVSATANDDLGRHPDTLCGSLAHYEPIDDGDEGSAVLLYVNGKALVDPVPFSFGGASHDVATVRSNQVYNLLPTHVTPRHRRRAASETAPEQGSAFIECLTGLGSTPAPPALHAALWRRRVHFLSVAMGHIGPLTSCHPLES